MMSNEKTPEYIEFLKSRINPNVKPEIAKMMIDYALTPDIHAQTLDKIRHYCFDGKIPSEQPKIFLIISQTGGGKSNLTSQIIKLNPNTVIIDSDAFKAFNPNKDEICEKYPTLYGFLTGIDAYLHRDEIYYEALQNNYDILIEIAPSTKDKLFNINFDELKNANYEVEANILAVSKINSLVSVHERYEGQIEAGMAAPKLTDLPRATDSYDSVKLVLEDLINMPEAKVNIWKRGNFKAGKGAIFLPSPELVTNDKNEAIDVYNKIQNEDEKLSLETALGRLSLIKKQMKLRGAPSEQYKQLEKIEQMVLLAKNNKTND